MFFLGITEKVKEFNEKYFVDNVTGEVIGDKTKEMTHEMKAFVADLIVATTSSDNTKSEDIMKVRLISCDQVILCDKVIII